MILEQCKGVHWVDLGESFQTHIFLQNLASIQPRMGPKKFESSSKKSSRRPPQALGPGVSDLQKGQSVQGDRFDLGGTGGVGTPHPREEDRFSVFLGGSGRKLAAFQHIAAGVC